MTKALNGTCRLVAAFMEVLFQFRHSGECAVVPCQKYYRATMIPYLNNCGKLGLGRRLRWQSKQKLPLPANYSHHCCQEHIREESDCSLGLLEWGEVDKDSLRLTVRLLETDFKKELLFKVFATADFVRIIGSICLSVYEITTLSLPFAKIIISS